MYQNWAVIETNGACLMAKSPVGRQAWGVLGECQRRRGAAADARGAARGQGWLGLAACGSAGSGLESGRDCKADQYYPDFFFESRMGAVIKQSQKWHARSDGALAVWRAASCAC